MYFYKGVVFDLDGTLLNTIEDIRNAVNYALNDLGYNELPIDTVKEFVGSGVNVLINRIINHLDILEDKKEECFVLLKAKYLDYYEKCQFECTKPYDGIIDVLSKLKQKGIKIAVLSNKPNNDTQRIINHYFPDTFDFVFGQMDSYPVKPDPGLLNHIIDCFELDRKEILYIGDSDVDILTAKNAYVDSVGAGYGFKSRDFLIKSGAKYVINMPSQIMHYFKEEIDGVLLVDKPYGMTSQDAITKVKRILNVKKIGHAGTLDPLATGLLVVLLGNATKLSNYLLEESKEYIAEITIGDETSTLDAESPVINHVDVERIDNIDGVLQGFVGDFEFTPPIYSAIKVNGRKLYDIARAGKNIEIEKRYAEIFSIERVSDIDYSNKVCKFSFKCRVSKGTYIRSLCEAIGKRFGYPAYMSGLRRIASGKMNIKDSNTIEDLQNGKYFLTSMLNAIGEKKVIHINDAIFSRVNNGMRIILKSCTEDEVFLAYKNILVGIYEKNKDQEFSYRAKRVWKLEE